MKWELFEKTQTEENSFYFFVPDKGLCVYSVKGSVHTNLFLLLPLLQWMDSVFLCITKAEWNVKIEADNSL